MALGAVWAIQNWIMLGFATFVFAAIYHYIILDEEIKLHRIFGAPYALYCKAVPRFFPRIWPPLMPAKKDDLVKINSESAHHHFSAPLAKQNKAYEAYASFLGLILFEVLAAYLWQTLS